MKNVLLFILFCSAIACPSQAQQKEPSDKQKKDITALIDKYSLARENKDTVLLKAILTTDVDQLVSTGEWCTVIRKRNAAQLCCYSGYKNIGR